MAGKASIPLYSYIFISLGPMPSSGPWDSAGHNFGSRRFAMGVPSSVRRVLGRRVPGAGPPVFSSGDADLVSVSGLL